MDKFLAAVIVIVGTFALALGIGLVFAFPIMWLMNYTFAPSLLISVFGTAKLTFWHAYTFSVLMSWMVKSTATSSSSK